jgi:hypothetical protein
MTNYEKIIHYMTEMLPDEATIVDGPTTYTSTQQAHKALARYLTTAKQGTSVHRTYTINAFDWLVLLKKKNIKMHNIIKE